MDTTKPFTVVTQFPAKDGVLQAMVRKYVQDGVHIGNTSKDTTITQEYCSAQVDAEMYNKLGGHKGVSDALARGMILAMSIWWDEDTGIQWLDDGEADPCNTAEGFSETIQEVERAPTVTFSQAKWGEIWSTFSAYAVATCRWRTWRKNERLASRSGSRFHGSVGIVTVMLCVCR